MDENTKGVCFSFLMGRWYIGTLLFLLLSISHSFGCWCGLGPASDYVGGASIAFVGKAVFSDDDGSRKFAQKTLVRFEVEEAFKGIGENIHVIWLDPGSFTSCYQTFHVGERYLVFAYEHADSPRDTMSITSAADNGRSKQKPIPTGFDVKNPPKVYWAPECLGTRRIAPQTEHEIDYLRNYKKQAEAKPTDRASEP